MPLQGTFDVLDFTEVLRLLSRHQLTGRLHVRHRSFGANLFLEGGQLTGADQSEHQPAAATGDVRGRIEEICFEMLEAERGSFEFQPGKASAMPTGSRHRVDTVLGQARKRLNQWRELQELIPSLELQPRLVGDLSQAEVTIDKERWRMLTAIDGRRNLRAIGRIVNVSDFDVCRIMAGLITDGVVELDGLAALSAASRDAMPTVPGPEPTDRAPTDGSDRSTAATIRTSGTRNVKETAGTETTGTGTTGTGTTGTGAEVPPADLPSAGAVPPAAGPGTDHPHPAVVTPLPRIPARPAGDGGAGAEEGTGSVDPARLVAAAAGRGAEEGRAAEDGEEPVAGPPKRGRLVRIRSRQPRPGPA